MTGLTRVIGILMLIGGLSVSVYMFCAFETTVQADSSTDGTPNTVHNIGLLNERECGLLFGGTFAVTGYLLYVIGIMEEEASRRKEEATAEKTASDVRPASVPTD